ncbi:MAG: hypothetical protein LBS57_04095 [Treponema sp.]|jgi:hypothetical protein|nr:hypothetical protein [Treponema sp.]
MTFTRLLPILCLVSLLAGAFSVFFGMALVPPARESPYAVLAVDEAVSDSEIRGALEGNLGVEVISESSQWVLLDNFGGLERIPLDAYKNRLDPRDPRNDGYAEKLRSFFVRGEERLFFIPFSGGGSGPAEKRISVLLGDLPFSLEYPGAGAPLLFYFLLFCCAAFGGLCFAGPALPILLCLSPSLGLAFLGFPGIVLGTLPACLSVLLRKPAAELCALLRTGKGRSDPSEYRRRIVRDVFGPWRYHWFLAFLFAGAYALLTFFLGLGVRAGQKGVFFLFAGGVFFAQLGLLFFSLMVFSRRGDARGHVRFSPVLIMKEDVRVSGFSRVALPYGLAALLLLLLDPFLPTVSSESSLAGDKRYLVYESDYLSHVEFQRSFSFRPLGSNAAGEAGQGNTEQSYSEFVMGEDGLVHAAGPGNGLAAGQDLEIPPFPLKKLTGFLRDGASPSGVSVAAGRPAGVGHLSAALMAVLFVIVPGFNRKFRKRRNSGLTCLRWGDKKRKKILLLRYKGVSKGSNRAFGGVPEKTVNSL